jgi:hypothetical protein
MSINTHYTSSNEARALIDAAPELLKALMSARLELGKQNVAAAREHRQTDESLALLAQIDAAIAKAAETKPSKKDQQIAEIAARILRIETTETRNSDRLDFHECAVWNIRAAMEAAYEAGKREREPERTMELTIHDLASDDLIDQLQADPCSPQLKSAILSESAETQEYADSRIREVMGWEED